MNIFDQLGKIYTEIDSTYATIEITARSKEHHKKEADYTTKRQFNDQAYFLYMFTRLEDRVRILSDSLIDDKMSTLTDWKSKRSWEIIQSSKNLHFMDRVALLTQKGGTDYNLVNQYYSQRNKIAHGGTFTITISIPNVISDMTRLYRDLKTR